MEHTRQSTDTASSGLPTGLVLSARAIAAYSRQDQCTGKTVVPLGGHCVRFGDDLSSLTCTDVQIACGVSGGRFELRSGQRIRFTGSRSLVHDVVFAAVAPDKQEGAEPPCVLLEGAAIQARRLDFKNCWLHSQSAGARIENCTVAGNREVNCCIHIDEPVGSPAASQDCVLIRACEASDGKLAALHISCLAAVSVNSGRCASRFE